MFCTTIDSVFLRHVDLSTYDTSCSISSLILIRPTSTMCLRVSDCLEHSTLPTKYKTFTISSFGCWVYVSRQFVHYTSRCSVSWSSVLERFGPITIKTCDSPSRHWETHRVSKVYPLQYPEKTQYFLYISFWNTIVIELL